MRPVSALRDAEKMSKIIQITEHDRKAGDFFSRSGLHERESGANKGSKSGEKKKGDLSVWREGWWLFTERDGGRQRGRKGGEPSGVVLIGLFENT